MFDFIKNLFKKKEPYIFNFKNFYNDFEALKSLDIELKSLEKKLEVADMLNQDIISDQIYKHCDKIDLITSNLVQIKLDDLSENKDKELVSQFIDYQKKKSLF